MRTALIGGEGHDGLGGAPHGKPESESDPAGRASSWTSRWLPRNGEESATILAVLPWLGAPVLISAALASAGRPIPGEVLPVIAFLPVVALAYMAAVRIPARRVALGFTGLAVLLALLAFLGQEAGAGAGLTFSVAASATMACTLAFYVVARALPSVPALLAASGAAMVFSQGLDGFLTYLAVDNPFGWLPEASTERVLVSRLVLEAAPPLYPLLKISIAVAVVWGLGRQSTRGDYFVPLVLVVCYAGLSPAMFSAAHMFAP
jgi:hypothetical protein